MVYASTLQDQINSLQAQNSQTESNLNSLQLQAASYQDAVNQLQSQIYSLRLAIQANEAKQVDLQQQIQSSDQQIAQQKQILGSYIKAIYVGGQMSTVEELATSKSLSDFVDSQTYRNAVQSQIQTTLAQITALEAQLKTQQVQVTQLLQTQNTQQAQLDAEESQQAQLLSYNQSQQAQYNQQIAANQSEIATLKAEQVAADAAIAKTVQYQPPSNQNAQAACNNGEGTGGYPLAWCNAYQDAIPTIPNDGGSGDNRECTSYAYWYFTSIEHQSGFNVSGNAGWWWETSNYPVTTWNSSVKDGAIGIEPSSSLSAPVRTYHTSIDGGYYGHVMIVQALPGESYPGFNNGQAVPSGDVLVSSMNEDGQGHFQLNLWPVNYLLFINPQ
jgi:peptidoglycan hydrolase CwlO-like protein